VISTALTRGLRDARECRRLSAIRRKIRRESAAARERQRTRVQNGQLILPLANLPWVLLRYGLPLLAPGFAWLATRHDGPMAERYWLFAAASLLLIGGRTHFLIPNTFRLSVIENLYLPSKTGVVLARVFERLPLLLMLGLCWAAAYAIRLGPLWHELPIRCGLLLVIAALTAIVWHCGRLVLGFAGLGESVLAPWAVVALLAFALSQSWPSRLSSEVMTAFFVAVAFAFQLYKKAFRGPRTLARTLLFELRTAPRIAVAAGLCVPSAVITAVPTVVLALATAALVVGVVTGLDALCQLVPRAETLPRVVPQRPPAEHRTIALPTHSTGRRSFVRALWSRHRAKHLDWLGAIDRPSKLVTLPGKIMLAVVFHFWGVALAAVAVAMSANDDVQATLALLAAVTAPTFVYHGLSQQLQLLGVDYREQVRNNVRAGLVFVLLPLVAIGGIQAVANEPDRARFAAVALLAGVTLVRIGWRGLTSELTRNILVAPAVIVAAAAATIVLPIHARIGLFVAGMAALVGLVGIGLRLRRSEATLAGAFRT